MDDEEDDDDLIVDMARDGNIDDNEDEDKFIYVIN